MTISASRGLYGAMCCVMLLIGGCASMQSDGLLDDSSGVTTYVLVRHAEKATDDLKDPVLTSAGQLRAERLAMRLAKTQIDQVFSTDYRRTRLTAAPTAAIHGLDVRIYDASMAAPVFVAQLRAARPRGTVLIVGHSNTVPKLAEALCACTVAPMHEDEYDRLIEIRIDADGDVGIEQMSY